MKRHRFPNPARPTGRRFVLCAAAVYLFALCPVAGLGEAEDGLIFGGSGLLPPRAGPDEAQDAKPTWGLSTYWATFGGGKATVTRLEAADRAGGRRSVAANGGIVWFTDRKSHATSYRRMPITLRYPDLKVREHPRAVPPSRNGWFVLSSEGRTLAYPVWTPLDDKGNAMQLDPEQQRDFYSGDFYFDPDRRSLPRIDIYCEDLDTGQTRILSGNWSRVEHLVWSPDAKKVAFYGDTLPPRGEGDYLYVVDVATGNHKRLSEPSRTVGLYDVGRQRFWSFRWAPVWSSKGDAIFFCARYGDDHEVGQIYCEFGQIYRVDAEGRTKPLAVSYGRCLRSTPDDQAIHVERSGEIGKICLVRLNEKRTETTLLSLPKMAPGCNPTLSLSGRWVAYHRDWSAIVIRSLQGPPVEMNIPEPGRRPDLERATGDFFWVNAPPPPGSGQQR